MPFLSSDGANMFYDTAGAGPAVLLIHAGIADSRMWASQIPPLSERYRTIWYDVRGFGRTTAPPMEFSHRTDLRALLDHLQVGRATLIGCSMGSRIALDFVLEHPERVASLVLLAPAASGGEPPADLVRQWDQVDEAVAAGEWERANEQEVRMWVDGPARTPAQVDPQVRTLVATMNLAVLKRDTEGYKPIPLEPPARARLREVGVPTLILVGAEDQPYVIETARLLADQIDDAELVMLMGTAHMPGMEKPELVNRLTLDFLENLR